MTKTSYTLASSHSDAVYPYYIVPETGTPVYPFRHSCRAPSAVAESLARELDKVLSNDNFNVFTDVCFKFSDGGYTYPASIIIRGGGESCVAVNVEIDEPYSLPDFVPRHYLEDSTDSHRDHLMSANGWIVVRLAEKQVAESVDVCCRYIVSIINALKILPLVGGTAGVAGKPAPVRKCSRVSAEYAAKCGAREDYLMRAGFALPEMERYADNAPLTSEEREIISLTTPDETAAYAPDNILKYNAEHRHERDSDIAFIPDTHTYLYKGCDKLKSVTTVISELFPAFDSLGMAEKKAREEDCSPNVFLDKWACASREAAETGTHMHAQIEKYFLGQKTNSTLHLRFDLPTLKCDKYVDIGKELKFFNDFISRANVNPYRTEWPIFDTEARIAGSPDLIAEKNGQLLMFDWKRSTKVVDAVAGRGINGVANLKCWNRYGFGAFSALPDCSFVHYSLQQAVYKRILARNYGIDIARTFLVVLHPQYEHFYIVETMDVEEYVDRIFKSVF